MDFAQLLDQAYRAAHYLHPDRVTALDVAGRALARLQVVAASQARRLEYEPRRPGRAQRNRVAFGERHLLQQLIFAESEPHERRREREGAGLSPEQAVVFFVKHLVQITVRRNSFYATLGIARVLHDYPTPKAQSVYDVVVQDPDRVKEDDYWRAAKGRLLDELEARFGERLRRQRGPRGEERFESVDPPGPLAAAVNEALAAFTPWDTDCPVPARFDPLENEVPALASRGPAEEGEVELRRIHAVLHPACWRRLTSAVGLEAPDRRLRVPDLRADPGPDDGKRPPPSARSAGDLLPGDRQALADGLNADAAQRRREAPAALLVKADGVACREWWPDRDRRVVLPLHPAASWLDVVTSGGGRELPLLCWPVPADAEAAGEQTRTLVLEGGQRITLNARPSGGAWSLEIEYVETAWRRRLQRAMRGVRPQVAAAWPAWAGATAAVLVAATAWRLATVTRDSVPVQPREVSQESPLPDSRVSETPLPAPAEERGEAEPPRVRTADDGDADGPRHLRAVHTLLVDVQGEAAAADALRSALVSRLAASGRFAVTGDPGRAEAALKATVQRRGPDRLDLQCHVVARDGRELWPATGRLQREQGSIDEVARRLAERLVAAGSPAQRGSPWSVNPAQ